MLIDCGIERSLQGLCPDAAGALAAGFVKRPDSNCMRKRDAMVLGNVSSRLLQRPVLQHAIKPQIRRHKEFRCTLLQDVTTPDASS